MKKCIVIGGGFAGLSSAVYLSKQNIKVKLIEASPKLGGRAYSLTNNQFNDVYDNGQHILMGCYTNTLDFLNIIGADHLLDVQDSLNICFVKKSGEIFKLNAPRRFYPLNLLWAMLNYKAIPLKARLKIIDFFLDLMCCVPEDIQNFTVTEWLKMKKQDEDTIKSFWEILVVGALNTSPEKAAAAVFVDILQEIFLNGSSNASIILPKVGLSELFTKPSAQYIEDKSGQISCSEKLIRFELANNRVVKVITNKSVYEDFDYVISAIPSNSLERILDDQSISSMIPSFNYSTILNVHLWLKENPFTEKFYGLIDSKIHWVFNHRQHISITISNADSYNDMDNTKILKEIYSDLEIFFPIFKSNFIADSMILKERHATFIPDIKSSYERKKINFNFENLFVAGDWTNTELPSTIESAVLSGKISAQSVINKISR
ncbi:MAG: hydroxysqualene dehydroxylase HpnE [Bacteroidota bacterium]